MRLLLSSHPQPLALKERVLHLAHRDFLMTLTNRQQGWSQFQIAHLLFLETGSKNLFTDDFQLSLASCQKSLDRVDQIAALPSRRSIFRDSLRLHRNHRRWPSSHHCSRLCHGLSYLILRMSLRTNSMKKKTSLPLCPLIFFRGIAWSAQTSNSYAWEELSHHLIAFSQSFCYRLC